MKAVVYTGPREFTVTDVPVPQPGPGQVLIKVEQAGLCGTDLHLDEGGFDPRYPLTPGHELVGTLDGVQVTVNPNRPCRRCEYCRSGRTILCENGLAVGVQEPGAFAEYVAVAEDQVFEVDGLDLDTATLVEPAACAMHGVETLDIRPGASALVLGAGPTGLLLAQLIGSGGASSVTVADPVAFKLETAAKLGIDRVVQLGRDPQANVELLDTYDIVVEATGIAAVGATCVALTKRGGTVLIYGVTHAEDTFPIHPYDVFRREITIKGSFAEMTSFGAAIAALRTGRARGTGLITHRFGLDDYGRALETLRSDPAAHKVVITP